MKRLLAQLHKKREGFTLVELIVVICVLAILAGIAVPAYSGYIKEARKASDLVLLEAVNKAFAAACLQNGIDVNDVESVVILLDDEKFGLIKSVKIKRAGDQGSYLLSDAEVQMLQESFDSIFEDNIDQHFEEGVDLLVWNNETGWTAVVSEKDTGSKLMKTYLRSSFWSHGSAEGVDGMLSAVNGLSSTIGQMSSVNLDGHLVIPIKELLKNADIRAFMVGEDELNMGSEAWAALLTAITSEAEPSETNKQAREQASAITVMYAASKLADMDAAEAIARGGSRQIDTTADGFVNETAGYAMLLGFAYYNKNYIAPTYNSSGEIIGQTILYKSLTDGDRVGGSNLQGWLSSDSDGHNEIMDSEEFRQYRESGQMERDMKAFLELMRMVNENQSAFDYTQVDSYDFFSSNSIRDPLLDVLGIPGN